MLAWRSPRPTRSRRCRASALAFLERDNSAANGVLDTLIREGRVSATMATSLMNDIDYARNVVWNLTEVGAILFGARDTEDRAAEMLIALDQDDIEEMYETEREPRKTARRIN